MKKFGEIQKTGEISMSPGMRPTPLVLYIKCDYKRLKEVIPQGNTMMTGKAGQERGNPTGGYHDDLKNGQERSNHMNTGLTELVFILDRRGSATFGRNRILCPGMYRTSGCSGGSD